MKTQRITSGWYDVTITNALGVTVIYSVRRAEGAWFLHYPNQDGEPRQHPDDVYTSKRAALEAVEEHASIY